MAKPETTKGGLLRVMLGKRPSNPSDPIVYGAPCGLSSKTLTLSKALEEIMIPDCDDPLAVDWVGRDATSLSMAIGGEGVVAEASIDTWLDAQESPDATPVRVELEFTLRTIIWLGFMHVESAELGAPSNTGRVTGNFSLQSDGEMVRSSVIKTP
ncbi:phage tail tube protein [Devosia sp. 2618]|uniref:phage tail tube protein n=1 Tax=Devosia sp. 2618 TaxID=3156454 RepID=UPI003391A698